MGYGEDLSADVAVEMRIADFVLEGPAAIGLKRTDPEGVPQRMYKRRVRIGVRRGGARGGRRGDGVPDDALDVSGLLLTLKLAH